MFQAFVSADALRTKYAMQSLRWRQHINWLLSNIVQLRPHGNDGTSTNKDWELLQRAWVGIQSPMLMRLRPKEMCLACAMFGYAMIPLEKSFLPGTMITSEAIRVVDPLTIGQNDVVTKSVISEDGCNQEGWPCPDSGEEKICCKLTGINPPTWWVLWVLWFLSPWHELILKRWLVWPKLMRKLQFHGTDRRLSSQICLKSQGIQVRCQRCLPDCKALVTKLWRHYQLDSNTTQDFPKHPK